MFNNRSHRRGYVLVLTLGLITLAAISLAGLARYSLGLASSAQDAAEQLQRRWGLLSACHVFMEGAAEILDERVPPKEAATPPWPKPAIVSASFNLGGQRFTITIADEDAKANLNTIYAENPKQFSTVVRRLNQAPGSFPVQLVPDKDNRRAFLSWGHVFNLGAVSSVGQASTALSGIRGYMTCWGTGRLNLRRASDASIYEIASLILSTKNAGELVSLRKTWGGQNVEELLAQLELRRTEQTAAAQLFSAESRDYSLWVEVENGHRGWTYEFVNDGGPACFSWRGD